MASVARDLLPAPLPFPVDGPPGPLAGKARATQRKVHRRRHWQYWCNDGVRTLNELYAGITDEEHRDFSPSQNLCLSALASEYERLGAPPSDLTAAGAFAELCGRPAGYADSEAGPRVSFKPGLAALSPAGGKPITTVDLLPDGDRMMGLDWRRRLLRDSSDAHHLLSELGVAKPYSDPVPVRGKKNYGGFLRNTSDAGMLRFTENLPATVGIFFVGKKDGRQRCIFDTRITNCYFRDPPHADLPTAAAYAKLETTKDAPLYISQGGLKNAFYHLGMFEGLDEYFILPPIEAGAMGITEVDGRAVGAKELVSPRLQVMAMGWTWSLHFCQKVLEELTRRCGVLRELLLNARVADSRLEPSGLRGAAYVDNSATFSHDPIIARETTQRIYDAAMHCCWPALP